MKTEQLRDELATVILDALIHDARGTAKCVQVDCEIAAQAVIDHIAPMMRKAALALEFYANNDYDFDALSEDAADLAGDDGIKARKALESIPEEWRKS